MIEPPYLVTHRITATDLRMFRNHMQRRPRIALFSLCIGVPVAIGAWMLLFPSPGQWSVFVGCTVITVVTLIGTLVSERWASDRQARRLAGIESATSIGPNGIDASEAGISSHFDWSAITEVETTARLLVLRSSSIPLLWFPRHAFGDLARQEAVITYIRQKAAEASSSHS
jgi:hypothetical protein